MSDEKADLPYWLVVMGESTEAAPQCIRCDTRDDFSQAVEQHILGAKTEVYAFAFHGERIQLGAPQPVAAFRHGEEDVQVGRSNFQFDETGRFLPLRRSDD